MVGAISGAFMAWRLFRRLFNDFWIVANHFDGRTGQQIAGYLHPAGDGKRPRWRRREVRSLQVDKTSFTRFISNYFYHLSADPERASPLGSQLPTQRDRQSLQRLKADCG